MTAFLTWFKDTVERAASTFAVAMLPLLFAGTTLNVDIATQAAAAGLVALASFLKTAALPAQGFGVLWLDVLSRSAWTGIQMVAGVAVADWQQWFNPTAWQTAALAAGAAAASIVKGLIASRLVKNTITPASLAHPAGSN